MALLKDIQRFNDDNFAASNSAMRACGHRPIPQPLPGFVGENRTDKDLNIGDVVGIDVPLYNNYLTRTDLPQYLSDFQQSNPPFRVVVPTVTSHLFNFAVAIESVPTRQSGESSYHRGRFIREGVVAVHLKVICMWHEYARIDDSQTDHMVSDCVGYRILWHDNISSKDSNGYVWALVLLGGTRPAMGIWYNAGGSTINPYEVAAITGAQSNYGSANSCVMAGCPANYAKHYIINGSTKVDGGSYGIRQLDEIIYVSTQNGYTNAGVKLGQGQLATGYPSICDWITYSGNFATGYDAVTTVAIGRYTGLQKIEFRLKSDLGPGWGVNNGWGATYGFGTATANPIGNGSVLTDTAIIVKDQTGTRRAFGSTTMGADQASHGWASVMNDGSFVIDSCTEVAKLCSCFTTAACGSGDGIISISQVSALDAGQVPPNITKCANPGYGNSQGFAIAANALCTIAWDEGNIAINQGQAYRMLDAPCQTS